MTIPDIPGALLRDPAAITLYYERLATRSQSAYLNAGLGSSLDRRERSDRLVTMMISQLTSRPPTVLDLGCGRGGTLQRLMERFPDTRAAGVDLSPTNVHIARRAVPQAHIVVGDYTRAEELPTSGNRVVLACETFLHTQPTTALRQSLRHAMAPGGTLLVADFFPVTSLNKWRSLLDFGSVSESDLTGAVLESLRIGGFRSGGGLIEPGWMQRALETGGGRYLLMHISHAWE